MKSKRQLGWVLATLVLLALGIGTALAQDGENSGIPTSVSYPPNGAAPGDPGNPTNDPPARVARIQYISGEVSLQPGGANDWVAASLNRPLTSSDRVWTDKNSRVELNVGNAFLRMDSESSLTFTNVGNSTIQAELDQGVVELTVQHLEPGEIFEIDTPNLAFTVMKSGVYRIDVRPSDDQTWVTVRKGNGQATGNGPAVKVSSGEQVRFTGQGSLQHEAYAAPAPDGFEDWAQVRDKRLDGSQSARYVAPGVIGYQDLDYYGTWRTVPTYGAVWVPTSVPAGWAPYRYGHWVWIAPWGWTWVDDAPWGFAPFHYGRWVSVGGYWGWAPGPVYVGWRPYYAPALVGWVGGAGWGFGVSFGVGFGGGCGWFPLGWGEAYYPWYHGYRGGYVSNTYIRNVNVTNTHITNITNVTNNYYHNAVGNTHYANRYVAGGVTAAPKSAFTSGQNIAKVGMAVPRADLGRGEVLRNNDIAPTRQAMLGGRTAGANGVPPRSAFSRPVVTQATPASRNNSRTLEARDIPPSPASLSVHSPAAESPGVSHSVPRPAEHPNGTNASSAYGKATQPATQPGSYHAVPRPPYTGGAAPNNASSAQHNTPGYSAGGTAPSQHEASRVQQAPSSAPSHSAPPSNTKDNGRKETPKFGSGMASGNVPQPPAGYSYRTAPSYGASSSREARNYGASPSPYVSSRSAYTSAAPAYRTGGSYAPAPAYNARAYSEVTPHYSAPAAPHYSAPSAPHYSGQAPSAHYSSGGGGGGGRAASSGSSHSSGHSR